MRRSVAFMLPTTLVFAALAVWCPTALGQELFRDDFDGSALDLDKWSCPERNWPIGQTWFVGCPEIRDGAAVFKHHTYNPYDLGGTPENPCPHDSTLSQEIFSEMRFPRCSGVEFEARVRVGTPITRGFVGSVFAYTDKEMGFGRHPIWSDEIDFEFLTNQIDVPPEPTGHRVWLATWNDFGAPGSDYYDGAHHWATNPVVPGLKLTDWNVFRFRWYLGRVEWYWDPTPGDASDPDMLISATSNALPNEPMSVRMNFWSCRRDWAEACEPLLYPAPNEAGDMVNYYYVDYVVVRSIGPTCGKPVHGDIDCDGRIGLDDYVSVTACLTAPCPGAQCDPASYPANCCSIADFDDDGDVDLRDFAEFQNALAVP